MSPTTIDHELDDMPKEYPIRMTATTRHGQEIVSHVYPLHEAKVLRARGER